MWILLVILAFRFCHGERFFADHISLPNSGNDAILLHVFHLQRAPRDEVSDEEFANIEKFEENAPLLGTSDGSGSSGAGSGEGGSSKKTSSMTSSSSSGRDKRVDASSIVLDLDAFTEKNEASKQAKNVKAEEKPPVVGGSSLLSKSSREPNDAVSLTSSSSSSTSSSSSSAPPATTPPASSSSSTTNAPPAAAAAPPATSSSATSPPTAVVDDNVAPSTQLFPPSSIPTALGEETKTKPDYSPPPSSNSTARNKKVARMKKKTNSTGTAGALVSSPAAATDSTTSSTVISENRTAAPTMAAAEDKKEKKDVVPKQESPSSKMNSTSSKTGSSSATGAATTPATSSVSSATTIASSSATNRTSSLVETEPSKGKGFKKKKNKKVPGLRVNATTVSVSPKTNNTKKSDSSVANEPIKSDPTAPVPKVADEAPKTDASRTPAKTETAAPSTKAGGVSSSPEISEVTAAPTKADAAAPAAADAALPPPPAKSEAAAPPPAKTESASAVAPNLPKSEPEKPPTTSNVEPVVSAPGTKSEPVKAPPAKSEPAAAPLPPETVSPQTTLVEQPSGEKGAPPPPPAPTTKSTTKTKSSSAVQNLNEDSGFGRRFLSRILEAAGGSSSPKASARMTSTTSTTSKGKIHGDEFLIDVPTRLIRRNTGAPAAAALGTSSGSTSSTYPADLRLVLLSYTQYLLSCGGNKMTECLCPTTTRSTIFPLLDGPPGGTTIGTSASSIRRKIPIPAQEGYFLLLLVNCNGGKIRRLGAAEENEKTFARPLRDLWPQAQVATDAVGAAPAGSSSLVVVSVRNEPPLQQLSPFSSSSTSRALAELPSSTTVELHGEITVQYHHGFLNASNLKKYQFYHTLLWCYLLLAAIWGCITLTAKAYFRSRGEVKMLLVHRYLTRVLLLCVIEVFLWYLKFRVWNGSGYRQWALLFLARMAYAVKVSMFWVMLSLIVAKCCGVYRLILSSNVKPVDDMGGKKQRTETCSLFSMIRGQFGERAKRVMNVALCYTFSEVLWNGVSIYRNQFTFVAPSDRTRFVGDRLFYGMTELIFVVFIATWILKTLKDNEPLMLQSKNEMLIQAYSRMTKVLRLAFALKIGVQALKYLYYPTTFGYSMLFSAYGSQREISFYDLGDSYWYFEVVLPHVLDFVVLLALFLIWYPRPEFSHVDTEDSRLATLEMTPEHMGGRNNGSFAGGGSSDIGNMNTSKGGMIEMSGGVPAGTLGGLFASFTSGLTSSTSGADGRNSTGGMLSSSYSGGGSKPSIVAELDDNFDGSGNSFSSTDQNETNTSAAASTIGTSSLAPNPAAPQTGVANKFSGGISSSFGGRTGAAAARAAAKSASSMNIKSSPSKGSSSTAGSSSGTTASTGGPTQQIVGLVNMQNASSAISSSSALADALRGTASQSQHMTTRIVPAPPTEPADNSHIGFGGVVTVRSPTEPPIDAAAGGSVASGVGRATVPPPTGTGPPKKITVSARLPKKKTGAAKQEAAGRLKIDH